MANNGPSFGYSTYLGGAPNVTRKKSGNLMFHDDVIGIGTLKPKAFTLKVEAITSIEIDGGQVAKSKVGAELMFGVLGGLGAKGAKNQAQLAVHTKNGAIIYFQIDKKSGPEVKAKIHPWMQAHGIPFTEEVKHAEVLQSMTGQSTPAADGPAEQLKKLADLHESGLLTDEEFEAKRSALVSRL